MLHLSTSNHQKALADLSKLHKSHPTKIPCTLSFNSEGEPDGIIYNPEDVQLASPISLQEANTILSIYSPTQLY